MISAFGLLASLLTLAALFGYLNYRLLRLPATIGLLVVALAFSLAVLVADVAAPGFGLRDAVGRVIREANLPSTLMNGALAFLLFAGALHVELRHLLARKWTIFILATVGVVLSTALVGFGMWAIFAALGPGLPLAWAFVLGAVVAPTDPVAVLGALKRIGVPPTLEATVAGESLFNDGVAVVAFTVLLSVATRQGAAPGALAVGLEFLREAGGGFGLGLATGWIAFFAMRTVDEANLELMISLALVTLTYSVAQAVGASGPVAVAVAGIIIGSIGFERAMSERTESHLRTFWSLVDEILNALLFLLIGLEVAVLSLDAQLLAAAALAIPLSLAVRAVSVTLPALPLHLHTPQKWRSVGVLTWGGLRGGVSVALALSIPASPHREQIVTATYGIVLFTMIVQGLTLPRVAGRLFPGNGG